MLTGKNCKLQNVTVYESQQIVPAYSNWEINMMGYGAALQHVTIAPTTCNRNNEVESFQIWFTAS